MTKVANFVKLYIFWPKITFCLFVSNDRIQKPAAGFKKIKYNRPFNGNRGNEVAQDDMEFDMEFDSYGKRIKVNNEIK